jgi:translocator protein
MRGGINGVVLGSARRMRSGALSYALTSAAALALMPYALWCAFATVLNADIARRNR